MTLYKQMIIILTALFIILFTSVFAISSKHLKDYIDTQLASHAQDAATSLGIAISSEMLAGDLSKIEAYVNAMFDSGYYRVIEVVDINGKLLFSKKRHSLEIHSVPVWVVESFTLETPQQSSGVMAGWQMAGTVNVVSFPEFAYQNLWNNLKSLFFLFFLIIFIMFLILSIGLRWLLKPLSDIIQQTDEISNKKFIQLDIKPVTREFQQVVDSMNKMSSHLKNIFLQQSAQIDKFKSKAFQDELTGLSNRMLFMQQLKYMETSDEKQSNGCLLLLQVHNLDGLNKVYGHQTSNDLLISVAQLFGKLNGRYSNSFAARLSGSEFALFVRSISFEQLEQLADNVQQSLDDISGSFYNDRSESEIIEIAHSGIVTVQSEHTISSLFSEADLALRIAQQKRMNACHIFEKQMTEISSYGSGQWHDIIIKALTNDNLELYFQAVIDTDKQIDHKETLVRLLYEGQLINAGVFIPMAEHLGITQSIDKWVIQQVIKRIISSDDQQTVYSINLSRNSLCATEFLTWLLGQLSLLSQQQQQQIMFETSEYMIQTELTHWRYLYQSLNKYSCKLAINHFGPGLSDTRYVNEFNIDYIKLDGSYCLGLEKVPEFRDYLEQLIVLCQSQEISLVATGIENRQALEQLKGMNIKLYQGFYLAKPEPPER